MGFSGPPGLLQPDAGTVYISGKNLKLESEQIRVKLGIIMHQSMVYADLTVLENLEFFARLYGITRPNECIADVLEQVGLTAFRYDKAADLSRGMLQRLSIARAMVHQPKVIFADEPFTGLDMTSANYLMSMLKDFRERGGTIILTSHDVFQGLQCADRVIVIDQGRFVFDAGIEQIDRNRFADNYLQYAGESA